MSKEMASLKAMFEESGSGEDDEDEDDEPPAKGRASSSAGHLAPGSRASAEVKRGLSKKAKTGEDGADVKKLLVAGLAQGQSPTELMPLMMMSLLLKDDQKKKKSKKEEKEDDFLALGGSSSDDSEDGGDKRDAGMKAVTTLHKLHRKIKTHPKQVYMLFEKEVIEELGVIPGQGR
jgi:hypothetical protein